MIRIDLGPSEPKTGPKKGEPGGNQGEPPVKDTGERSDDL